LTDDATNGISTLQTNTTRKKDKQHLASLLLLMTAKGKRKLKQIIKKSCRHLSIINSRFDEVQRKYSNGI